VVIVPPNIDLCNVPEPIFLILYLNINGSILYAKLMAIKMMACHFQVGLHIFQLKHTFPFKHFGDGFNLQFQIAFNLLVDCFDRSADKPYGGYHYNQYDNERNGKKQANFQW